VVSSEPAAADETPILVELAERLRAETVDRVPGRLATLIEWRVGQLLGITVGGDSTVGGSLPTDLDDAERAVIDVTEQFMVDVHGLTDRQLAVLDAYYSHADIVAIMFHLALVDGFAKLRLVAGDDTVVP
jgi:hypothetical protein